MDTVVSPSLSIEHEKKPKFYLAPMVRYSKLAFRQLVRLYEVDVCYTPMIYAKNFIESEKCRQSELSVCAEDNPLIVQFATDDPIVLAEAAEMVYKCSQGVDLNCGCPKHDVRSKGFGSALLSKPELLADMVRQTRARISDSEFSISLKIRINHDLEKTVDLCRKAEAAGVTHLTVHGRTPSQKAEPIDIESIRIVKSSVTVPVIANGGITTRKEALFLAEQTGADGIMAANGLLDNPALFAGFEYTPVDCVEHFMRLSKEHGLDWLLYHQHLQYMLRPILSAQQRRIFNELNGRLAVDQFLTNLLS
uniref:tRNA-dihydrouridine synthase n=1 Tax=Caenorhabditis tropicalis TaxID=1561998 RepID=A0A1I7U3J8_9PELO